MPRVKRGTTKTKKRNALLKLTKGYRFGRKSKKKMAYEAVTHAGVHAFNHRRKRKGVMRRSWQVAISGGLKRAGSDLSYSKFIPALRAKGIELDRKILSNLAQNHEGTFKAIVEVVK